MEQQKEYKTVQPQTRLNRIIHTSHTGGYFAMPSKDRVKILSRCKYPVSGVAGVSLYQGYLPRSTLDKVERKMEGSKGIWLTEGMYVSPGDPAS
jgi:hypothetical protein